ncbi:MAG: DUF4241 domain-containing protein [Anaeromicrobium sp.]|jgi:hypothetical protein|uniref:DUF4241 domain-containing protein n=1 Tax=Anaeromicrobium sp. TaxID=1929132 RepID=UPI0025F460C6|nr:DUF4241 domain-containing protein [Anaeromicrobium sp.]MCT4595463.1 DUF4241 domain-containing protein [Anaeromicrobium sp.]
MSVTKEWLSKWELKRKKLSSPVDYNEYYTSSNIAGREIDILSIGYCSIPSGEILVREPLCFSASTHEKPYFQTAPKGEFLVELCVVKPTKDDCARCATARIRFTGAEAVRFEEALIDYEDLDDLGEDDYYGFNVDAGLACICDKTVHRAYCDFYEKWHIEHENDEGNIYLDYFADLFEKSYKISPKYQCSDGDWINWKIPETDYHMPIFSSGFGDGTYPVYWGYDKDGVICQMIVEFIDIRLAYEEEEKENG